MLFSYVRVLHLFYVTYPCLNENTMNRSKKYKIKTKNEILVLFQGEQIKRNIEKPKKQKKPKRRTLMMCRFVFFVFSSFWTFWEKCPEPRKTKNKQKNKTTDPHEE